ncbi:MAG TPA: cytidylate kinase-like family protein [Bacteroidales bacterium]|nr:cytidylate kinase-like family protein [Bacteroidales bacterium]HPS63333.1 cytidylate kinase-like family protein [Bacteroidales bacterium]
MENLLHEYMDRAFAGRDLGKPAGPLPVVTISREFGCPSKMIAQHLTAELNRLCGAAKPGRWRFINKEVVEDAARRLEMQPAEVNFMLNAGGKGLVEDVLASFSPGYVSSHRMRKTITSVVQSIAAQGFVVIVGRGGAGILRHAPATLHIRLTAPREWRTEAVVKSKGIPASEAVRMIDDMDRKRISLIELMAGEKFNPYLFDVTFNCAKLNQDDIVHTITGLMASKNMIG